MTVGQGHIVQGHTAQGHTVQGLAVRDLAEEFGTPLYLYDGAVIERQYLGLRERLHPAVELFYSLKANPNVSICALLHGLGARAEVSSLVELETVLAVGVPAEQILFLGPGKSETEIEACLKAGILAVICESFDELALIDRTAERLGVVARVVLRVNPAFQVKSSGLTMGGKPRQFGIDEEQLLAAPGLAGAHRSVRLTGVQAYPGTRFLSEETLVDNIRRILDLAERVATRLGFEPELVDVGGGLGVAYFAGELDLDVERLTAGINPVVDAFRTRRPGTRLAMELGRYLVAHSGLYVTTVRSVKESLGERFAVADGGTNHHLTAVGIGSAIRRNFPVRLLNRDGAQQTARWNLTGPLCTPSDTLAKGALLPADLRAGDLLGVERSGAYGPTASPVFFLSHGYPAEVLVHRGRARLIRRRDRVEDLLGPQILHDFHDGFHDDPTAERSS
ncbi:type III PLP-dependent enzyme [Streptacidiphilus jiangxiensis]|uniref:Diaminopimelate decarboxylase n=1 Tax=Streptacidiphilus jiangxiensis TaxID=235985 RepID=A0A1H7JIL8_STRJI|nr:type III PLP-dependent enzyme [Streptacidiphilus jiangxiensis]SEK74236.1 diaminopimelate decarboxylase [Streptacidiphilus jiangxiensis]